MHLAVTVGNSQRKKVEANVQKIAHELIEIYAKRQLSKSRSFNPPEKELQLFANDFAFVETEDQLVAIVIKF